MVYNPLLFNSGFFTFTLSSKFKHFVLLHRSLLLLLGCFIISKSFSQQQRDSIVSFRMIEDVKITLDYSDNFSSAKKTILILYALPNGSTTEQTMGKKIRPGDDWHFDIQHICAQTKFIRHQLPNKNIVVAYLENNLKSWPAWKKIHADYLPIIHHIVDTLYSLINSTKKIVCLNGHSGGGSFIFGYLAGVKKIPSFIKRISFLDSDYNYDSTYYSKLKSWLIHVKNSHLTVFAYNDSIALYNGKPFVSPTGGTWYRSHLMLNDLSTEFRFDKIQGDSITIYQTKNKKIGFFFKENHDRGIYHTMQVELNGFIHSIFFGTKKESKGYNYYGPRAYEEFIK